MKAKFLKLLILILLVSACSQRNLVYFSDIDSISEYSVEITQISEVRIKPYDRLRITVNSPSVDSNMLFNRGSIRGNLDMVNGLEARVDNNDQNVYLVNANGLIEFPILGQIKLEGLTLEEARDEMKFLLKTQVKEPNVNLVITNFRVSVIGEVNRPSNFLIGAEKINVMEALGLAGDLTPYGKRENVMIIREVDGNRNVYRVNLNKKDILNSPYYYLQQNDIVYVEPDDQKFKDSRNNTTLITVISVASSVLVAIIFNYQNLFN